MAKGNPLVCFGLEPEVIDLLRQRVDPVKGRAGGVSLYLRRLVYEDLGLPMPVQYGDLGRSSRKRKPTGRPRGRPRKNVEAAGEEAPAAGAVEHPHREAKP